MDNSATSSPKPREVTRAVIKSIENGFGNPGRSISADSLRASNEVYCARCSVGELVGASPENVIFTYNATYALNMVLFGLVREGMTVAVDRFAHNSVLRPLYRLEAMGRELVFLDTDLERGSVMISSLERLVKRKKIDVLVVTHTSNVTGKLLPVRRLTSICRKHGILSVVDASQGIGSSSVMLDSLGADVIVSSGHKGLYGIMGSGFAAFREGMAERITPLVLGGNGMMSFEKQMPEALPERLEAGTLGLPSIVSMRAGADFIKKVGIDEIRYKEKKLRKRLIEGLSVMRGVKLYNADVDANSIVLFNLNGVSSEETAAFLDEKGVAVRAGYHCAPLVHLLVGEGETDYDGAVRLSVGYFNTERECDKVLKIINSIKK